MLYCEKCAPLIGCCLTCVGLSAYRILLLTVQFLIMTHVFGFVGNSLR